MGLLFKFLLLFIGVLVVYRAARRMLLPLMKRGEVGGGEQDVIHRGEMVKDPVCGTYVPRDGSPSLMDGGREHFFCSPRCRELFQHRREDGE